MKIHVLVCFLLVCVTLVRADPIRAKFSDNVENNIIDSDAETYDKQQALNSLRFAKEIQQIPSGLHVYNDNGDPVEIVLTTEAAGDESESETRRSLDSHVKFLLYTRHNPVNYQQLFINNKKALASSHFNAAKPTRFVTHGWVNTANSPICTLIRNAYLKNDDVNVIVVDWGRITMGSYVWASMRVLMVGRQLAMMIDFLEEHANLNTNETTLVGHSLGAHVAGLGGFYAKGTINYIVGLDPALPMFYFAGPGSRISSNDANHVQIIHTNAGLLGFREAIGHSDFYPNGGSKQLGCLMDIGGVCSHARSYLFFAESINSKDGFYGKPCSSYLQFVSGQCKTKSIAVMGGPLIGFVPPGIYFLDTKSEPLFAKGI